MCGYVLQSIIETRKTTKTAHRAGGKTMKARTVILFVIAKLMAFAITASAAVMSYLPLAYLAYEERGYFAIGGEVLGALIITAVVGWAANIVMKDWFRDMLKLFGKEKKI